MANQLYNQCRVYCAPWRLDALNLNDIIDQWIDDGLLPPLIHTFLPYRDDAGASSEEEIFVNDVANMDNSVGVVGYFDGGTYDSGCAWEVGYAWALGMPVHLITTDFLLWAAGNSTEFYPISKLTNYVANVVSVSDSDVSISNYREQTNDIIKRALQIFQQNLIADFGTAITPAVPITSLPIEYDYYLDPNFMYTELSRGLLEKIKDAISSAGKTFIVGDNMNDIATDIDNLRKSRQAIFYSDTFEPNVDTGIMNGIAYALGQQSIIYCSKQQKYKSALATDYLNLMITWSSTVAHSFAELEVLIGNTKL
ncbi:nucleoside 2-deoxyribosyltransferase [Escherichia albertii]|uniref:nucleoside 2-deoxyribosyltransferase n=1 Tax=Escherichia albertii TaxID=208962 RepID=UPI00195E3487|nr:nucleoside 2-deoxyribosyltransferase [Escherichia albertii]EFO0997882.1 nucleoside 2-deoxyribosyltransferase [Escherichia albertii]ELY3287410.1 nucleoside 2-deoxyribosyltransferase [Escherichia albertii]MCQ8935007.1 nucleoside 2-deoxyribosyltransferase [Escherichia albertii]MCU7309494.1 nucleoside 2-deoxyribosyltransferase [Escherichia albertii]MCZ8676083.1 nucleoside 2-deoxyribosyltransferase [Escherichia albertii]